MSKIEQSRKRMALASDDKHDESEPCDPIDAWFLACAKRIGTVVQRDATVEEEDLDKELAEKNDDALEARKRERAAQDKNKPWALRRMLNGRVVKCKGETCECHSHKEEMRQLNLEDQASHYWPEVLDKYEAWEGYWRKDMLKKLLAKEIKNDKERRVQLMRLSGVFTYWPKDCCYFCGGTGEEQDEACDSCMCGSCGGEMVACGGCSAPSDVTLDDYKELVQ